MKKIFVILCSVILLAASGCCFQKHCKLKIASNAVLLDVRTLEEYKEGYLAGAILIPLAELESNIVSKVPEKKTPIYIYCRSGRRAGIAAEKLKPLGYSELYNLGGLQDAQEKLDLPIKK